MQRDTIEIMDMLKKIAIELATIHLNKNIKQNSDGTIEIFYKWGSIILKINNDHGASRPLLTLYQSGKNDRGRE